MKQRYLMNDNGESHINYCVDFGGNKRAESFKSFYNQSNLYISFESLRPEINIDEVCRLQNSNEEFNIKNEGEFFVKTSSYSNTKELLYARELAVEDDIRFKLYNKLINTTTCPELNNIFIFLNMDEQTFYQSFLSAGVGLRELYTLQRPDLPSIKQLEDKMLQELSMEDIKANDSAIVDTKSWIDKALKTVIGQNTNIIFKQIYDCHNSSLVIVPRLDLSALASEQLIYNNDTITQIFVEIIMPNTSAGWSETMHSFAHIFLDHPNENGLYPIDATQLELFRESFKVGTIFNCQQCFEVYKVQSLLPWDIEALRYSYGIPKAKEITYYLNNLKEHFDYYLENKALITLSNIGNTTINTSDITNYSLDLRYEHVSNFTNGNIRCYNVVLHENNYQNEVVMQFNNLDCIIAQQIDIYNFDSSLHGLIAQQQEE